MATDLSHQMRHQTPEPPLDTAVQWHAMLKAFKGVNSVPIRFACKSKYRLCRSQEADGAVDRQATYITHSHLRNLGLLEHRAPVLPSPGEQVVCINVIKS